MFEACKHFEFGYNISRLKNFRGLQTFRVWIQHFEVENFFEFGYNNFEACKDFEVGYNISRLNIFSSSKIFRGLSIKFKISSLDPVWASLPYSNKFVTYTLS